MVNLHGVFRLRVGVLERLYLWTYGTHTFMIDQTEVRNAENVRKRHFVMKKKKNVCVYRSDYMKSLPGQFIRIRLKNGAKLSLVLGHF